MLAVWLSALVLVPLGLTGLVITLGRMEAPRWGTVPGPTTDGGVGAYRRGPLTSEVLRGTPKDVMKASMLAAVWGAITLLVFVPAGLLFTAVAADASRHSFVVLFGLGASLSGLFVALALIGAGLQLVRRGRTSIEEALLVVRFSHAHHVAVWVGLVVSMALLGGRPSELVVWALAIGVPCVTGLAIGRALDLAAKDALALRRAEAFVQPDQGASSGEPASSSPASSTAASVS